MANRHYIKKKSQTKPYSPSSGNSSYLTSDDSENLVDSSLGPVYEQIKSEVVSSVLNWLSLYMAADQEDKVSEIENELGHCCECIVSKRVQKSNAFTDSYHKNHLASNYISPENRNATSVDGTPFSGESGHITKPDKVSDTPEDVNMIMTDFRAGQVWPDWCNYLEKTVGKHSSGNVANSQVYYDRINDRLCVYRRGLVEYPQLNNNKSPRIETSDINFKQNLMSIPEIRESLLKNDGNLLKENSPVECLKEPNKYLFSPAYRSKNSFENLGFGDNYTNFNVNQTYTDPVYGNYSKMVKWMSLPNFQFR